MTAPAPTHLPIGQVARVLGLKQHVMRYWESKFDALAPMISDRTRMYNVDDIRLFSALQTLLHDQGLTMNAVQRKIETEGLDEILKLATVDMSAVSIEAESSLPPMLDVDGATANDGAGSETCRPSGEEAHPAAGPTEEAEEHGRILTVILGQKHYIFAADRLRALSEDRQRHLFGLRDRLAEKAALQDFGS